MHWTATAWQLSLSSCLMNLFLPSCHVSHAVLSWPGLTDTYLLYMHKEVVDYKKQLDATALKVFKTIFTAADNTDRCGEQRSPGSGSVPAFPLSFPHTACVGG